MRYFIYKSSFDTFNMVKGITKIANFIHAGIPHCHTIADIQFVIFVPKSQKLSYSEQILKANSILLQSLYETANLLLMKVDRIEG